MRTYVSNTVGGQWAAMMSHRQMVFHTRFLSLLYSRSDNRFCEQLFQARLHALVVIEQMSALRRMITIGEFIGISSIIDNRHITMSYYNRDQRIESIKFVAISNGTIERTINATTNSINSRELHTMQSIR